MDLSISMSALQAQGHKIMHKVPLFLRDDSKKGDDYDPKVVSIGPYHYGKSHLEFVQKFKPHALNMFIKSDSDEISLLEKIGTHIPDVRRCYVDLPYIPDGEFAQMILLDACFVLLFIEINTEWPSSTAEVASKRRSTRDYLGTSVYLIATHDLYLLENQLPFWILELVFSLIHGYGYGKKFVEKVEKYCYDMFFDKQEEEKFERNEKDLPRSHLLDVFRRVLVRGTYNVGDGMTGASRYVFRSVTELKSKGINFKPSKINSLKQGVRYDSGAVLKLPPWYVDIYTRKFFMNMIAYELDPYSTKQKTVSAYVNFMKSLVNSPEDVKELREKRILLNSIGSDQEVVQVYSCLNTYGMDDPFVFMEVKGQITHHCDSKVKTCFAELKNKYFSSPWSAISLFAAILLFILTAIQTIYAVKEGGNPKTGSGSGSGSGPGFDPGY